MRDACLVFVPDGADSLLSILKEKFKENTQLENAETPFELMYVFIYIQPISISLTTHI
jgi:hypothetical protein